MSKYTTMVITAVLLCSLDIWNGALLVLGRGWYVCIGVCLNSDLLFVIDAVRGRDITLLDVMSKYTTMAMTAMRSCSLDVWNGVMLALGKRWYVCIGVCA